MALLRKNLFVWILPVGIALVIFIIARPAFAGLVEREVQLSSFLSENSVPVGRALDDNGVMQIYYQFAGKQVFVTDNNYPHIDPVSDEKYIVWSSLIDGHWQVFLHNIPSEETIQLTSNNGNNVRAKISQGRVVWEGQVDGLWQVFLYENGQIKQLSSEEGQPSVNSDIFGDYVVFATKQASRGWKLFAYDVVSDQEISLTQGSFSKKPILRGETVYWDDFDGVDRGILSYSLLERRRGRITPRDIQSYGVRIEGDKLLWLEEEPEPEVIEEEVPEDATSDQGPAQGSGSETEQPADETPSDEEEQPPDQEDNPDQTGGGESEPAPEEPPAQEKPKKKIIQKEAPLPEIEEPIEEEAVEEPPKVQLEEVRDEFADVIEEVAAANDGTVVGEPPATESAIPESTGESGGDSSPSAEPSLEE